MVLWPLRISCLSLPHQRILHFLVAGNPHFYTESACLCLQNQFGPEEERVFGGAGVMRVLCSVGLVCEASGNMSLPPLKTGGLESQLQDTRGSTVTYNMNGAESWNTIKWVVGCVEPAFAHPQPG